VGKTRSSGNTETPSSLPCPAHPPSPWNHPAVDTLRETTAGYSCSKAIHTDTDTDTQAHLHRAAAELGELFLQLSISRQLSSFQSGRARKSAAPPHGILILFELALRLLAQVRHLQSFCRRCLGLKGLFPVVKRHCVHALQQSALRRVCREQRNFPLAHGGDEAADSHFQRLGQHVCRQPFYKLRDRGELAQHRIGLIYHCPGPVPRSTRAPHGVGAGIRGTATSRIPGSGQQLAPIEVSSQNRKLLLTARRVGGERRGGPVQLSQVRPLGRRRPRRESRRRSPGLLPEGRRDNLA